MNERFDKLAKGVAESVTRRQALRRFGVGLAGMALASFASKARAISCRDSGQPCDPDTGGGSGDSCSHCCSDLGDCHIDKSGVLRCVCS